MNTTKQKPQDKQKPAAPSNNKPAGQKNQQNPSRKSK